MPEHEQTDPEPTVLGARWAAQAKRIDWFTRPEIVADGSGVRLVGGLVNLCFNALDRHVIRGRADELALVTDRRTYSYAQLLEQVAQLGGGLRELGVRVGDRVLAALPDGDERVIALLACARVGAVHSAGPLTGPGLEEISEATTPKVVIGPTRPQGEHRPDFCVIFPAGEAAELGVFDIAWGVLMKPGSFQPAACAEVPATQASEATGPEPVGLRLVRLATERGEVGQAEDVVISEGDDQLLAVLIAGRTAVLRG